MRQDIIGIMGAMHEEVHEIIGLMEATSSTEIAGRIYYEGAIHGKKVVVVFSRWGKVAAASTTTTLIREFGIRQLIFTGVAGAISPELKVGDVVLGERLYQHDMDARPLMKQFEIPLLNRTFFEAPSQHSELIHKKLTRLFNPDKRIMDDMRKECERFNIVDPRLHFGDIASGDRFIASQESKEQICSWLPGILCVEMEGAAVAQVCHENDIPFSIIRTISDSANAKAEIDFTEFIQKIAGKYSARIINNLLID